jgi:large subunit ribosomal protein L17
MRHGISGRKLNRTSSHRKLLLQNLAISLIKNKQIKTTLPKAKELRPYTEKLVTLLKEPTLSNKRHALSFLRDINIVNELAKISDVFKNRNGGYTRILKYGFRTGDSAPMAIIEFVNNDSEA